MKLVDRELVQGTENPAVYLARRVLPVRGGAPKISKRWSAVYFDGKKQRVKKLGTRYKPEAFKAAHDLHRMLVRGESTATPEVLSVDQLVGEYLAMLEARGRSSKTITKYTRVLGDFVGVCEKGLAWKRDKSKKTSSGGTANGR